MPHDWKEEYGETPIRSTDRHSCRQNETTRRRQSRIWNLWESGQGFGTVTRNRMGCQWMERLLRFRFWWCLISLVCSIQSLFENWKKKFVSNGNELKNFSCSRETMPIISAPNNDILMWIVINLVRQWNFCDVREWREVEFCRLRDAWTTFRGYSTTKHQFIN